jgi:hypothetical protein
MKLFHMSARSSKGVSLINPLSRSPDEKIKATGIYKHTLVGVSVRVNAFRCASERGAGGGRSLTQCIWPRARLSAGCWLSELVGRRRRHAAQRVEWMQSDKMRLCITINKCTTTTAVVAAAATTTTAYINKVTVSEREKEAAGAGGEHFHLLGKRAPTLA